MAYAGKRIMPKGITNASAKLVRDLRAKLGLTQEQFAAKVGVTWSTVSRWENGRGTPSPLATRRITELLDDESREKRKRR